ncbi:MAG: InlB B-repeat-containing protein [Treponema sp.]|nr:InlB B-repeat-containing protein [Treponema sp.]
MKRKILSAFAVLCVLIFASCADFDTAEQQDKHTDGSSACITISLSEASRTAFPTIDKQGENWSTSGTKCYPFDSITLKGTPVTENAVAAVPVEKTWETEKVGLKYTYAVTKMEGASINVTAGATYMFTLTARHGNNSWQGTVGKTIMSGTNSLSFTLELNSLSSESYGELFVQLTVPETVKAADAVLKNLDESQIIMQGENVYSSQYPTMATFSNRLVPAGSYVVVFTLWGDEGKTLKLGEWREYAQVSSGETSESHPVIKDLSSIHTVTFRSMITQNRNNYGGGYNSAYIKEVSVLYGDTVERPQDPEPDSRPSSDDNPENIYFNRDDDFFSGWYVSEDGGNTICDTAFDFSTPITSDTVLVANFETVEYSYATSADGEFTQFKFNDEDECALTAGEKIYLKARSSSESTVVKYKLDNGEYKDIVPTEAIPLSLGSHDICIKLAEAETEYKLKISASYNQVTGLDASAYLGGLDIKWNSYGGDSRVEAAGENGGYFIFVAKSLYDYTTTPLVSADEIRTDSDYIENDMGSKGYFCKKLTTQILNSGYAVILNPPPKNGLCAHSVCLCRNQRR